MMQNMLRFWIEYPRFCLHYRIIYVQLADGGGALYSEYDFERTWVVFVNARTVNNQEDMDTIDERGMIMSLRPFHYIVLSERIKSTCSH